MSSRRSVNKTATAGSFRTEADFGDSRVESEPDGTPPLLRELAALEKRLDELEHSAWRHDDIVPRRRAFDLPIRFIGIPNLSGLGRSVPTGPSSRKLRLALWSVLALMVFSYVSFSSLLFQTAHTPMSAAGVAVASAGLAAAPAPSTAQICSGGNALPPLTERKAEVEKAPVGETSK